MSTHADKPLSSFLERGYASLGPILEPAQCKVLLDKIVSKSKFSRALFRDEEDFRANPNPGGVNPAPGRNILEDIDTSFLEESPTLQQILTVILGPGYAILNKKVVAAIPGAWIPKWTRDEIAQLSVPNLGAFVKPEYGNISYFYGIPYHQDLIDYPERSSDFVTVYAYLNDVTETESPLFIIPDSHRFGATTFPHDLECRTKGARSETWIYSDRDGREMQVQHEMLCGTAGSVYMWHPCILHGTLPSKLKRSNPTNRISLRYIVAKSQKGNECLIDKVNEQIEGRLTLKDKENIQIATGT